MLILGFCLGVISGGCLVGYIVWKHMKAQIVAKLSQKASDVLGSVG